MNVRGHIAGPTKADNQSDPPSRSSSRPWSSSVSTAGNLRGIPGNLQANPVNGTCSLSIPFDISNTRESPEGRLQPNLALHYDSGSGNGCFGQGWNIPVAFIERSTLRGVPRYEDDTSLNSCEIYVSSELGELTPKLKTNHGGIIIRDQSGLASVASREIGPYICIEYLPLCQRDFTVIEKYCHKDRPDDTFWRIMTPRGRAMFFGRSSTSRVQDDQGNSVRICKWLLDEVYDCYGNAMLHTYDLDHSQDTADLDHRLEVNRHIRSIHYGNRLPVDCPMPSKFHTTKLISNADWLFEIVFDYGDGCSSVQKSKAANVAPPARLDSYSSFRTGFEVRNSRLCRRVLMNHHMKENLGLETCLVKSWAFKYKESATTTVLERISTIYNTVEVATSSSEPQYISREDSPWTFHYVEATAIEDLKPRLLTEDDPENCFMNRPARDIVSMDMDTDGRTIPVILSDHAWSKVDWDECSLRSGPRLPHLHPIIEDIPNTGISSATFTDLQGSHEKEILQGTGDFDCGYYPRQGYPQSEWDPFVPLSRNPLFARDMASIRFVDLTGAGLADVLIILDGEELIWYPSCAREGFESSLPAVMECGPKSLPQRILDASSSAVFIGDMTGDGLADLIKVTAQEICYWPNLGWGKFGPPRRMTNNPVLTKHDLFDVEQIMLADIDGSGTSDLLHLGPDGCLRCYSNHCGYAWADAQVLIGVAGLQDIKQLTVQDVGDSGLPSLCWSAHSVEDKGGLYTHAIDLFPDGKPHLLKSYTNGKGLETRIDYESSVFYSNRDRDEGQPWRTRMPFPVQCVSRTTTYDHVARYIEITDYSYRDGYYDKRRQEFRGFSSVQIDESEGVVSSDLDGTFPEIGTFDSVQPQSRWKLWFATGATTWWDKHQALSHADEYFTPSEDTSKWHPVFRQIQQMPTLTLEDAETLTFKDQHAADNAIHGALLHAELYSPKYNTWQLRTLQHTLQCVSTHQTSGDMVSNSLPNAVFSFRPSLITDIELDSNQADSRVRQHFLLEWNEYNMDKRSVSVSYSRCVDNKPGPAHIMLVEKDYATTDSRSSLDDLRSRQYLRLPAIAEERHSRIWNSASVSIYSPETLRSLMAQADRLVVPISEISAKTPAKSCTSKLRVLYFSDDLHTVLPNSSQGTLGLVAQYYQLALDKDMVKDLSSKLSSSTHLPVGGSLSGFLDNLSKGAAHVDLDSDGGFWIPLENRTYGPLNALGVPDLDVAKARFYQMTAHQNARGGRTTVELDQYKLLACKTIDPVGNETKIEYDYARLLASTVEDANECIVQTKHRDAFCVQTAQCGSQTSPSGYQVPTTATEVRLEALEAFVRNPSQHKAASLLGDATSMNIVRPVARSSKEPSYAVTLQRDTPGTASPVSIHIQYLDGRGNAILSFDAVGASGDSTGRGQWLCQGFRLHDRSGNLVRQHHPEYTDLPVFYMPPSTLPASYRMLDAQGRLVAKLFPDGTFEKTERTPWSVTEYDKGDTFGLQSFEDDEELLSRLKPLLGGTTSWPKTWLSHNNVSSGDEIGRLAFEQSKRYTATTVQHQLDASSNVAVSTQKSGGTKSLATRVMYDAAGNICEVIDTLGRTVEKRLYDLAGRRYWQIEMDKGVTVKIFDSLGQLVLVQEDTHTHSYEYDLSSRLLRHLTSSNGTGEILVKQIVYGEAVTDAKAQGLRGRPAEIFDQSGKTTYIGYDQNGNATHVFRSINVSGSPSGSSAAVATTNHTWTRTARYDSSSKLLEEDCNGFKLVTEYDRNSQPSSILYAASTSGATPTICLHNVAYNQHGKVISMQHGQSVIIKLSYDPLQCLLTGQKLTGRDDEVLQDLSYVRDCMGKICSERDSTRMNTSTVTSSSGAIFTFQYDGIGRLTRANGLQILDGSAIGPTADPPLRLRNLSTLDPKLYEETYTYDDGGNMTLLDHKCKSDDASSWSRAFAYTEASAIEEKHTCNKLSSMTTKTTTRTVQDTLSYQPRGLPTSTSGYDLDWDAESQLTRLTQDTGSLSISYLYNHDRRRSAKTSVKAGTIVSRKLYFDNHEVEQTIDAQSQTVVDEIWTTYVRFLGSVVARLVQVKVEKGNAVTVPATQTFMVSSARPSVSLEIDEAGSLISYEDFNPFGTSTAYVRNQDAAGRKSVRFMAKEEDAESGFVYCANRFYVPWLARWLSPDPIGLADGLNIYEFVHGDPINFHDPEGLDTRGTETTPPRNNAPATPSRNATRVAQMAQVAPEQPAVMSNASYLATLSAANKVTAAGTVGVALTVGTMLFPATALKVVSRYPGSFLMPKVITPMTQKALETYMPNMVKSPWVTGAVGAYMFGKVVEKAAAPLQTRMNIPVDQIPLAKREVIRAGPRTRSELHEADIIRTQMARQAAVQESPAHHAITGYGTGETSRPQ